MKKGRIIFGLILNLLIVGGVSFALTNALLAFWGAGPRFANVLDIFYSFAVDASILLAVASVFMIIVDIAMLAGKKSCGFVQGLKLIGVVATTITAGMVIGYFYAVKKQPLDVLYNLEYGLFIYAIVPALGLISFIVENEPRMKPVPHAFLGIIPAAAYGGAFVTLLILNVLPKEKAPYDFLILNTTEIWISIAWIGGFVVGSYLLALLLLILHNIGAKKKGAKAKEAAEPAPEEKPAEEPAPEFPPVNKAEPAPEEKAEEAAPEEKAEEPAPAEPEEEKKAESESEQAEEKPAPEKKPEEVTVLAPRTAYARPKLKTSPNVRTYHITKQPNGEWQVKLAGGQKAIKLFPTQREAIAFARGLVESRGGSYRIHSVKGKIRS